MTIDYPCLVYGGTSGPACCTILYKYVGEGARLLMSLDDTEKGAATKGQKYAISYAPKLNKLYETSSKNYENLYMALKGSKYWIEDLVGDDTYLPGSHISLRACAPGDLEILKRSKIPEAKITPEMLNATSESIKSCLNVPFDTKNIFAHEERPWNISAFLERLKGSIALDQALRPNTIKYIGENQGILLELDYGYKKEIVRTQKLLVCRGIGNIDFERQVCKTDQKESELLKKLGFMRYYKLIQTAQVLLPPEVSNIFWPEKHISITNEGNNHVGVQYKSNDRGRSANHWDYDTFLAEKAIHKKELIEKFPILDNIGGLYVNDFMCAMTLDMEASQSASTKMLEFTITQSVNPYIRYINLTYFTALGTAFAALPSSFNYL